MTEVECSSLNSALREFEAVEANLTKLEQVWTTIASCLQLDYRQIGQVVSSRYEDYRRSFIDLAESLPAIDGWNIHSYPMSFEDAVFLKLRTAERMGIAGDSDRFLVMAELLKPTQDLKEYRARFNKTRKRLVRPELDKLCGVVDEALAHLAPLVEPDPDGEYPDGSEKVLSIKGFAPRWEALKSAVKQMDILLGSIPRPPRWSDLQRHLQYGQLRDLNDIIKADWISIRPILSKIFYGELDPLPITVQDLGAVVASKPTGPVVIQLKWEALSDEDFERLIFALISHEEGYENPEWLMKTRAPDRGRDLSVTHVQIDQLMGTIRKRVIIQCKHWLKNSIGDEAIASLITQMKHWEPPKVDICIVVTSGRFSSDAVASIEKHNQSDNNLRIVMWAESSLERLLALRPHLIAEFGLR